MPSIPTIPMSQTIPLPAEKQFEFPLSMSVCSQFNMPAKKSGTLKKNSNFHFAFLLSFEFPYC